MKLYFLIFWLKFYENAERRCRKIYVRLGFGDLDAILAVEAAFKFFSEVVEKRVNADKEVSVEKSIEETADNPGAGETQNVDESTDGGNSQQDHHRLHFVVVALKTNS